MTRTSIPASLTCLLLVFACAQPSERNDPQAEETPHAEIRVAAPLPGSPSFYDQAMLVNLDSRKPEETTGLHNVYRLSPNIISGSEPHGAAAFEAIRDMGVKTILSVDGMPPEGDLAAGYGLRYVHVPIQYSGIREREIERIAKTFVELEGPFFVHCFHGKHRGPAGAAIGRLVLDGASREEALAEMRQWCGTSKKYEGLYRTIATAAMPDRDRLAALDFDFPTVHRVQGIVPLMSQIARAHDNVLDLMDDDFALDESHPDIDPLNEAKKLQAFLMATLEQAREDEKPEDFLRWSDDSAAAAGRLVSALTALKAGERNRLDEARDSFGEVRSLCSTCHVAYRDH